MLRPCRANSAQYYGGGSSIGDALSCGKVEELSELKNDLLDGAKAAADYLGLPARTVYHLAAEGRIPAIRMGAKLLFRKSELERTFSAAAA